MTITEVRQALVELDLRPSKALGQNFLIDGNILQIILREAHVRDDETVIEVGPGLGALTAELASRAKHVVAIEKDSRLVDFLRRQYSGIDLIHADAVDVLRAGMPVPPGERFKVVANLPYSISTPVLECFVEGEPKPGMMVLTLQREVGQRLAAKPRTKDYGALTLFTQVYYHVTLAHIVSAKCFFPAPHVESAIVVLERRDLRVRLEPGAPFHDIVRHGFNQRRKMLRKLLVSFGEVDAAFQQVGIATSVRAEELSVEQWISLANALQP